MRRIIIILLGLFLVSGCKSVQTPIEKTAIDLEELWKELERFEKEGLWQSALNAINDHKIDILGAENINASIKLIQKGLVYHDYLSFRDALIAVEWLRESIQYANRNTTAFLNSILAEYIERYWQANAWTIKEISHNPLERPDDMHYWSARNLLEFIDSLYAVSLNLSNPGEKIKDYGEIISWGHDAKDFDPSAYYLMADRYIRFWLKDHQVKFDTLQPNLEGSDLFAPSNLFVQAEIPDRGKYYKILQLYQNLLKYAEEIENPLLLLRTDLDRLAYCWSKSNDDSKTELYEQALEFLLDKHRTTDLFSEIARHTAQYFHSYKDSPDRNLCLENIIKAKLICESCVQNKGQQSESCQSILNQIIAPEHQVQLEHVVPVNTPILAQITHRNIDNLNFRIYRLSEQLKEEWQKLDVEDRQEWIKKLDPIRSWQQPITDENDHMEHRVEIGINGLPSGEYLLWSQNQTEQYNIFKVSNLALMSSQESGQSVLYVLDRMTGNPIQNILVQLFVSHYDREKRSQVWNLQEEGKSDENGKMIIKQNTNGFFKVRLFSDQDSIILDEQVHVQKQNRYDRTRQHTFMFTDRSIYRPGQLIQFKGIALEKDSDQMPSYLAGREVRIDLLDGNGQVIDNKSFRTNDYGSFGGVFLLPEGGLKGQYRLRSSVGNQIHTIQVEEYKRPKFVVSLDTLYGIPRLDELVTVSGKADSYTGFGLQQAKVKYRVTEVPTYRPYYSFFSRYFNHSPVLISQGQTQTENDGTFKFDFLPVSGQETKSRSYQVLVEVTDQNGETHMSEKTYLLDLVGKRMFLNHDKYWLIDGRQQVNISYRSSQGKDLQGNIKVQLFLLNDPERFVRNRLWSAPDQWLLSKSEFTESFPYDPYEQEDRIDHWPQKELVEEGIISVNGSREWTPASKLEPGGYKIIITENDISDTSFFYVSSNGSLPINGLSINGKSKMEVGDSLNLDVFYSPDCPKYIVRSSRNQQVHFWTRKPQMDLLADASQQGGMILAVYQLYLNRRQGIRHQVDIPWSSRKANIEVITFRDKILPGSSESWTIKAKNQDGTPLRGVLTSTLYDASLDAIQAHNWQLSWFPRHYAYSGSRYYGLGVTLSRPLIYFNYNADYHPRGWFDLVNYRGHQQGGYSVGMVRGAKVERNQAVEMEPAMAEDAVGEEMLEESDLEQAQPDSPVMPIRKNLNESVFFIDNQVLDENGEATIRFTMNEALTEWNWKLFVHGNHLTHAYYENSVVTAKQLMVFPNFPRIIREGDELILPVKIRNEQHQTIQASSTLELFNPVTKAIYPDLLISDSTVQINIDKKGTSTATWIIRIPESFKQPLAYRISAVTDQYSDGEEGFLPVLSNQTRVIETLPIYVNAEELEKIDLSRQLNIEKLSGEDAVITLEMNEQPLWEVVKSLPLLLEDQYPNTISCIHRIFGNIVTQYIFDQNPDIQKLLAQWKSENALSSPLQQNQEVKNILLEETPWLSEALRETEHQKLLAELAGSNVLNQHISSDIRELHSYQTPQGGFSWVAGGRPNFSTTLYVLRLLDRVKNIPVHIQEVDQLESSLAPQIWQYLDEQMQIKYERDQKLEKDKFLLSNNVLDYLRLRLKNTDIYPIEPDQAELINFYRSLAYDHWVELSIRNQIAIAHLANQEKKLELSNKILASILERSHLDPVRGRYWNTSNTSHFGDHSLSVQSDIIELLLLTNASDSITQSCRQWLVSSKHTQMWKSRSGVADAVYSLLSSKETISIEKLKPVIVHWGGHDFKADNAAISYTGYWKTQTKEVPNSWVLEIDNPNEHQVRGAVYLQYFEDLDEISGFQSSDLSVQRDLYYTRNDGKVYPLTDQSLEPGDRIRISVRITSNHRYEFVHLRDIRGSGLESLQQLSRYEYKSGIGFYQSPSDAGQDFFIPVLPPGTFQFEYDVVVAQRGKYSSGNCTIQCLYAPEYAAHSAGSMIEIIPVQ